MGKAACATLLGLLVSAASAAAPSEADLPALRIYLLRDVKVDGEMIRLGDLGVIVCNEARAEAAARELAMGRSPWPKETLSFDRHTILSRLASSGVIKGRVWFTGADKVAVSRQEQTISAQELLAAAERFLQSTPPPGTPKGCIHKVVREPQEITLSGAAKPELACSVGPEPAAGRVRVLVAALRDGKQVALREVLYQRLHPVRTAVTRELIPAGAVISEANAEVRTDYSEQPQQADWKPPFGLLAVRAIQAGAVIRPSLTAEKKPDLVIQRGQTVRMRVQGAGFVITGVGQAIEEGRPGDHIKVRNVDSQRVVTALVAFDGSVEPVCAR